jgi:MOSC domain-containing protein YiiM
MRIESVQTGQARTLGAEGALDPMDRPWTSAIWKEPVLGRVWLGKEGLTGDVQVSRPGHGGPERALLFYAADHYPRWRAEWQTRDVSPGGFGENLTVSGADETTICVGDVWQIGDARIEVSGPREPCNNLVRRHRRKTIIEEVRATARAGWYVRVLREGWVEAGMSAALVDRPYPQWPIARAARVKRARTTDPESARLLAACPALLADWRASLSR